MNIESAPSSISTSFSSGTSNEAGFNFNPSTGSMVDLKTETYTQPFEASAIQTLDLPQDFSYPEYDLSQDSQAIPHLDQNLFNLPIFEFQAEKFIDEINLPQSLTADLELPKRGQFETIEKEVDTFAIEDAIAQIQTSLDLSSEEQTIWAPKFEKLLEEKIAEKIDEPADFAQVTPIDEGTENQTNVKSAEAIENILIELRPNAETIILPKINAEAQTLVQKDELQAVTQTDSEQNTDVQTETEAVSETDDDNLPPIDVDDAKTDPEWEVWEINKTKQVASESLKRRLELSSRIIHKSTHNMSIPIKDLVKRQVYKLDIPNTQDVIESVNLPPVAHFAELGLSKIGEDADPGDVHKTLTDAITSTLPTKITKTVKPKGVIKESQLAHGAKDIAAGAKHIYHDDKKGYSRQESATRTHPWEADKEAA